MWRAWRRYAARTWRVPIGVAVAAIGVAAIATLADLDAVARVAGATGWFIGFTGAAWALFADHRFGREGG